MTLYVPGALDFSAKNVEQSRILHITNLVRPFTLPQLKQLLSQTGTFEHDRFWINSIRSHCYVTYQTIKQAYATILALNKVRWPQYSPRLLCVRYATIQDYERAIRLPVRRPNVSGYREYQLKPSLGPIHGLNQERENWLRRRNFNGKW